MNNSRGRTNEVRVTEDFIRQAFLQVDLQGFSQDPTDVDTVIVCVGLPSGRIRQVKFAVSDFIPKNDW